MVRGGRALTVVGSFALVGASGQGQFDALACMTEYARGRPTLSTSTSPQTRLGSSAKIGMEGIQPG